MMTGQIRAAAVGVLGLMLGVFLCWGGAEAIDITGTWDARLAWEIYTQGFPTGKSTVDGQLLISPHPSPTYAVLVAVRLDPFGTLFLGPALNEDVHASTRGDLATSTCNSYPWGPYDPATLAGTVSVDPVEGTGRISGDILSVSRADWFFACRFTATRVSTANPGIACP